MTRKPTLRELTTGIAAPPTLPQGTTGAGMRTLGRSPGCMCGGTGCRWCSFEDFAAEFVVMRETEDRSCTSRALSSLGQLHERLAAAGGARRAMVRVLGITALLAAVFAIAAPLLVAAGTGLALTRAARSFRDDAELDLGRPMWALAWIPLALCGFAIATGAEPVADGLWITLDPDQVLAAWSAQSRQLWLVGGATSLGALAGFAWLTTSATTR